MLPPDLNENSALFLDFDGVLVEIAARPDAVEVPAGLPEMLRRLHSALNGAVALISGRHVADLQKFLPDLQAVIAGSHGAEIALGGEIQPAFRIDLDVATIHAAAHDMAKDHAALLIEEKPHGVVMHYRADPGLESFVRSAMSDLQARFPGTKLQPAKMAVELLPQGAGKDGALARLMADPPFAGRIPVYAGDDLTDEPAMVEAISRGGVAIKIGEGDSLAQYRMSGPKDLAAWLDSQFRG